MDYKRRISDEILNDYLQAMGAVLIEGPKWCGKTTTAMQQAKSILQFQDPDTRDGYLVTAQQKPSFLLEGATPRLIDEWQVAPTLWDAVRTMVDKRGLTGQFILTGSNSVDFSKVMHSGIGRIARIVMFPMSLFESMESNGKISLKLLFNDPQYDIDGCTSDMKIEDLIFAACRGGWPASLSPQTDKYQLLVANQYVSSLCKTDISTIDGVERNEKLTKRILWSYARNISTLAKRNALLQDVNGNEERCSPRTFDSYIAALTRLFVIQNIGAWNPSIRSATAIRQGEKREFVDPSIAVAALGLNPDRLKMDLKTFGFIFENMCIRDLKAYSQPMNGNVEFYRDRYGLEADAVLHLPDGRYALIECKLGSREIEQGANHLLKIKQLVGEYNKKEKQVKLREPDLLIVVTGGQIAYTRPDGVKIIPLACLRD